MFPLQVIDSFLHPYNVGQALLLILILATLGALPLKSKKILGMQFSVFGVIFLLTPFATHENQSYLFLGIALVLVGPLLWTTARE